MFGKTNESWLIVGLGNPGKEYERTRHNAGFRAIDLLAGKLGCKIDRLKFQGLYCQSTYGGKQLYLLKPQTYMNLSGEAVKLAGAFYKIPPERVIVIYDDIAIPLGKVRVRANGSAGGHNGIKSIIAHLGSDKFPRVKVGVGSPTNPEYDLADWVLSNFTPAERETLAATFPAVQAGTELLIKGDLAGAQQRCNGVGAC